MKGAKRCLTRCITLCIPLFGSVRLSLLLPSKNVQHSNVSCLRSAVASFGSLSFLRLPLLVVLSLCISLSFPSVAHASIAVTAWEGFWNAMKAMDLVTGAWRTANAAEELRDLSAQIGMFTGSRGDRQYIAKELEKVSGYDIDLDNGYMATVYGVTGNSNYSPVRQCSNCLGGYLAVDNQQVTCPVCHGTATVYWEQVPYTATIEAAQELSAWINYLTATQTDWSGISSSEVPSSDTASVHSQYALTCNRKSGSVYDYRAYSGTFSNDSVSYNPNKRIAYSNYVSSFYFRTDVRIYLHPNVINWINGVMSDGKSVVLSASRYSGDNLYMYIGAFVCDSFSVSSGSGDEVIFTMTNGKFYGFGVSFGYYDSDGIFYMFTNPNPETEYAVSTCSPDYYIFLNNPVNSNQGSGTQWGVDVDWYEDQGTASVGGDTHITNEGDTIYNSETNTYVTNNNIDVEPITQRLDILNAINAQIGIDLRTLDASMFKELNDLEWWLQKIYYNLANVNNNLEDIRREMANLDRSTNDLVDLSTLESGVSGLSSDIGALLSAITGSHGSDALGLYGRLDTVLNWLDDYTPVDVSGIEQALENWPDYPTFDDSGLLNAITGSHGSDLLGLFGRLDNVLSWLDDYVSPDLSMLNHQLGDLLDADGQIPTVHGLIYSVNGYVEDIDGLLSDVLALGTVTVNGTTYGFADLLYNTWLDLSRLVGMSTVTAGEDTYSFADLLYNVWVDFGRLRDWLVEWWADLFARLDDIIDAIEDLPHDGANPWHTSPVVDPSDPEGGPIIGPIETDPYGYPKMPDWTVYKEPLNIPALEHAVDELMTKFPFSMLNTIIQVALFIERPAVAPQFDIPAPNPSDWSQPYLVHIDLSDYDTVAATLRLGIVIWAIVKISNRTINMWVGDKGGE